MKCNLFAIVLGLFLSSSLYAQDISGGETSYIGAKILEGDIDVFFMDFEAINDPDDESSPYAFFEGNTLYAGNSDFRGNTVDAIIEFFWFESSIDRGSDFYVAVIKTRVTPGDDCHWAPFEWADGVKCRLWTDQWQDIGEHPVLSVTALTDIDLEQGAFRWDWSIPFETYGIDAYGQVTLKNEYGIGVNSEGAAVAHDSYQVDEEGNLAAEGNIQIKGFANEQYSVKTQYNVTLWEWEIFVDGRADLMAWDMYLNLSARDKQSAYHEYFLSIQVAEGEMFTLDQINILSNFDIGWYNPLHHEVGLSIGPIIINQPFYELIQPEENPEEETPPDSVQKYDAGLEENLPIPVHHADAGLNPPGHMDETIEVSIEEESKDQFSDFRNIDWEFYDQSAASVDERSASSDSVTGKETGCNTFGSTNTSLLFLFVCMGIHILRQKTCKLSNV
jgi:hypothetical protein